MREGDAVNERTVDVEAGGGKESAKARNEKHRWHLGEDAEYD
jgi:hypothetical protein